MKIVIPEIPPSLNQILRMHYHKRNNEVERWAALVAFFNNKKPKNLEKAKVRLTYFFPDKRRRDPDNYAGKVIMDGLVGAGIIKDDSFSNIILEIEGDVDKQNPRTEIEVVSLQDGD